MLDQWQCSTVVICKTHATIDENQQASFHSSVFRQTVRYETASKRTGRTEDERDPRHVVSHLSRRYNQQHLQSKYGTCIQTTVHWCLGNTLRSTVRCCKPTQFRLRCEWRPQNTAWEGQGRWNTCRLCAGATTGCDISTVRPKNRPIGENKKKIYLKANVI